jgi:hypothetical protein
LQVRHISLAPTCAMILMDSAAIESEMSINCLSLSSDGPPLRSSPNTEHV